MRKLNRYGRLPFNDKLRETARKLRKSGNMPEAMLWKRLCKKQFLGLDFDRQKIIGNFIVDFFCVEKGVVIEVDGGIHNVEQEHDKVKDDFLKSFGLKVVHITDTDVIYNIEQVMESLLAFPEFYREDWI
ncbi:MAG: endonuclease domain-containing protein [Oscillospiraceae bacterium]|jgi:very-short-patch-repair endonuclease|nr:endonuclease domain-containing protein [Oscillospiraceae bacterium]